MISVPMAGIMVWILDQGDLRGYLIQLQFIDTELGNRNQAVTYSSLHSEVL